MFYPTEDKQQENYPFMSCGRDILRAIYLPMRYILRMRYVSLCETRIGPLDNILSSRRITVSELPTTIAVGNGPPPYFSKAETGMISFALQ